MSLQLDVRRSNALSVHAMEFALYSIDPHALVVVVSRTTLNKLYSAKGWNGWTKLLKVGFTLLCREE